MAPKIVVITGCSTGIGLETAVLLASDKDQRFKVYATMRNLAKKDQLEKAAGDTLNKTLFIREFDVTKKESQDTFLKNLKEEAGDVDILVNNAGVGNFGIPEEVTEEETTKVYETNVFGLFRLTHAVIPGMKAKKYGRIIMISSVAGLVGTSFSHIYASSKFAVEGFSEALAPYLAQFNIRVALIEPGPVGTSFFTNAKNNSSKEEPVRDELTKELYKKKAESMKKPYFPVQTGKEIADIIQEAILAEKPHLRYQTSDFLSKEIGFKYSDTTGDKAVDYVTKYNGWA